MTPVRRTPLLQVLAVAAVFLAVGRVVPPLIVRFGGNVPLVSWFAAVLLVLAAVIIGVLAWNTWKALHREKRRVQSHHALRLLALAKASVAAGSVVAGFYGGYAWAYVDDWDVELARDRVLHGGAVAIAGVLLIVAGLLLERACVVPSDDDEDGAQKSGGAKKKVDRRAPEPGLGRKQP